MDRRGNEKNKQFFVVKNSEYGKSGFQPMVGVAQLVEHWVVASVVVGSNPITHPIYYHHKGGRLRLPSLWNLNNSV